MNKPLLPRKDVNVVVLFTNDYFAGEWNEESRRRLRTYLNCWDSCGPWYWIASGGLCNREGMTIAESIVKQMYVHDGRATAYLIGQEEIGVDTVTQLQQIKPIFSGFCRKRGHVDNPRLFAVSDSLALWSMVGIADRIGLELYGLPSSLTGGWRYKLGRLATEIARFIFGLTDPLFQHPRWERMRQIRIERALSRAPGENYFHL